MAKIEAEAKLNHLKFWRLAPQDIQQDVKLKGQFDADGVSLKVTKLEWIGNPVEKTYKGDVHRIAHEQVHLLGYSLEPPKDWKDLKVKIKNQLQDNVEWTLKAPDRLLVPAAKKVVAEKQPDSKRPPDLGLPTNAYHFECYPIWNENEISLTVELLDQFDKTFRPDKDGHGGKLDQHEKITGLAPRWFCVPVSKTLDGKTEEIPDKDKDPLKNPHLALYVIHAPPALNPYRWAWAKDQFHKKDKSFLVQVQQALLLAVPTDKVKVTKSTDR